MVAESIRVILADDHVVVRAGLKAILGMAHDITVVGTASNGREAVDLLAREPADVIVMDLSMAVLDGISATREIVQRGIRAKVLVLTGHEEDEYAIEALNAGAAGFLTKHAAEHELMTAIRVLAHGGSYVRPGANRKQHDLPCEADRKRLDELSDREHEVLVLVARGFSGPAIGQQLAISAKTVDTYRQRINEKLGLSGRPDYVEFALRTGVLSATPASNVALPRLPVPALLDEDA